MNRLSIALVFITAAGLQLSGCGGARERDPSSGQPDAGAGQGQDAGGVDLSGFTEYGSGEYAILLSGGAEPRRYCWYIEETVRICGGSGSPTRDDYVRNVCFDDETNCLARQPEDSENETSSCWTRITYDNVSRGPLFGTCDRVDAYFDDDPSTDCLYHRHCPDGMQCADYQCVCPPGVQCGCSECGPPGPARCDGDTLVTQRLGEGCDEAGRCFYDEVRLDCAASGGRCDASRAECVGGQGQPDAGAGQDAGTPDAGCQCPPTLPPGCEGDRIVTTTCDPQTCEVTRAETDCAAQGLICDPETVTCIEDVQCRVAADCPPPGPTPIGVCATVTCEAGACVETQEPC